MNWNEFKKNALSIGFKLGYKEEFTYRDNLEEALLLYRKDGLMIWATSFDGMTEINEATLIGEIILNCKKVRVNIPCCAGYHDYDNNKMNFEADVRLGLNSFIKQIQQYGQLVPQWEQEDKVLRFLNYGSDEKNNNNYSNISKRKMELLCNDAKKIVKKYLD